MSDWQIRKSGTGSRREGRRSLAAYGSHARGTPLFESRSSAKDTRPAATERQRRRVATVASTGAAFAFAALWPFVAGPARELLHVARDPGTVPDTNAQSQSPWTESEGMCMKRKPSIESLETVSLDEAKAYLDHAGGDELDAAYALAWDRNRLDGSIAAPDAAEVHHAFFLLCRARGTDAPSFDEMRVELRRRAAA